MAREQPRAGHGQRHRCAGDRQSVGTRVSQAPALHQRLEHAAVGDAQVELLAQLVQRGDAPGVPAHLEDGVDGAVAEALDRGQAEAHALGHHREVQLALVDVRRQHGDAALAALADVERQLVGVGRLDGQQRRREVARDSWP